jgi:hypothetical protein
MMHGRKSIKLIDKVTGGYKIPSQFEILSIAIGRLPNMISENSRTE